MIRISRAIGTRILACFMCVVIACTLVPAYAFANTPYLSYPSSVSKVPDVSAPYAAVFSSDGTVLWSKNADTQVPMASTTKILTAIVVLEHANLNDEVTVSEYAASQEPTSADLYEGQTLTVRDLLYGLLLVSGNDAAVALAEYIGGSPEGFAAMMNEKAAQLGMNNSHFVTPNGLEDPAHYTTVSDYVKLTLYAMQNNDFRTIIGSTSYSFSDKNGVPYVYKNANELLTKTAAYASSSDALGTVIGLKTGFTDEAGYCLVSAANNKNLEMYAIVFGDSSAWSRFKDSACLLEWGFSHTNNVSLISAKAVVGAYACCAWPDKKIDLVAGYAVNAWVYDYGGDVTCTVALNETTQALHAGDTVGTIVWYQAGKVIGQAPLCIVEDVPTPNFFESIGIWFGNLFSTVTGHGNEKTASTLAIPATLTTNTIG